MPGRYQDIKRAIVLPTYPVAALEEDTAEFLLRVFRTFAENYTRLAQEVITCHNQIQVDQKAVTAAAATYTWVLPAPFFDANYSAFATPDWGTTVFYSGKTKSQIVFNFGTAAPGGGGNLLLYAIR